MLFPAAKTPPKPARGTPALRQYRCREMLPHIASNFFRPQNFIFLFGLGSVRGLEGVNGSDRSGIAP